MKTFLTKTKNEIEGPKIICKTFEEAKEYLNILNINKKELYRIYGEQIIIAIQ